MYIISYDFQSNKRRAKFARLLEKYGRRLQYSVFEIKHSQRVLENIRTKIDKEHAPYFTNADSIVIFPLCEGCKKKVGRYGYAVNEEKEVVIF